MKRWVNLLTEHVRLRMLVRRRLRQWSVVWAAALVLSGAWSGWRYIQVRQLRDLLAARQAEAAPVEQTRSENEAIRLQLQRLQHRRSLLALLEQGQLPYHVLAVVSRSSRLCDRQIQVRDLLLSHVTVGPPAPSAPRGGPTKSAAPPSEQVVLSLKGVAADNLSVARFAAALRESRTFAQVDLKSAVQDGDLTAAGCSYWIECVLGRP